MDALTGIAGKTKLLTRFSKLMDHFIRSACILGMVAFLFSNPSHAQGSRGGSPQPPLAPSDLASVDQDKTLGLFLLIGQSNMKGRGLIDMAPKTDPRIWFLHPERRNWFVAREPLHAIGTPEKPDPGDNAGTGSGMSFAMNILGKTQDDVIGLIPAAIGGAPISAYDKDGKLYVRSLEMLQDGRKLSSAQKSVRAILWLQGESDSNTQAQLDAYEARLLDLIDRYRRDLGDPDLPFIVCTIGSFIAAGEKAKRFPFSEEINKILLNLPEKRKRTACVDARDLVGHIGDQLHYDTGSQIEIGKRYAKAYLDLMAK
jgi:hypothetical protein